MNCRVAKTGIDVITKSTTALPASCVSFDGMCLDDTDS